MEKPHRVYSVGDTLQAIAVMGILLVLMYLGRPVLGPILLAVFISAIAYPGFRWLRHRGAPPGLAVVGLIVITATIILLLGALLGLGAERLLTGLETYNVDLLNRFTELQAAFENMPFDLFGFVLLINPEIAISLLGLGLKAIIEIASTLLFSLVLVGFFLLEAPRFRQIVSSLPENLFLSSTPKLIETVIAYFGIRTLLNFITGVGFFILLWLLGVDYALLWGALTFVLSYIPYIGLLTAMIPPILLGYAESGPGVALIVLIGAVAFNLRWKTSWNRH